MQISIHQSKAEKFIHLLLLTIAPIAALRLPFGAQPQTASCFTSIGLPQPENRLYVSSFQPGGTSFLYNLANITKGKLSYNSGGQPGKIEKTQWVFIYVYLCMGIEAAVHPTFNAFTSTRYNLHWHRLLFPDIVCELRWGRTNIWKAGFVNLTVLNRTILLDNWF